MIPNKYGYSTWVTVDIVATTLSIAGSLIMGYFCLMFLRHTRSVQVRIIFSIAMSDFIFSISNALSNFEKGETVGLLCQSEAIIRQGGYFMTIYFTVIAGIFASRVSKLQTEESKLRFFHKSIAYGLLLCFITLLGPFIFRKEVAIRNGPLYCEINFAHENTVLMKFLILMFYEGFPMIIGTILTLKSYLHVIREIKALPECLISQLNVKVYSLLWYPIVLFASFLPCLLDSLYRFSRPADEMVPFWIIGLHILLPHSIGFTNALVYGVQRKLYSNSFAEDEGTVAATIDISGEEYDEEDDEQDLRNELLRAERLSSKNYMGH